MDAPENTRHWLTLRHNSRKNTMDSLTVITIVFSSGVDKRKRKRKRKPLARKQKRKRKRTPELLF